MNLRYLSFGCHNLTAGSSRTRSERLVHCALDLGLTRFDVAPSYGLGTAERMLGDALGPRRSDPTIDITTKFGILPTRHGAIKAWLREPVRLARRLTGKAEAAGAPGFVAAQGGASPMTEPSEHPDADPRTPAQAAERSLRALRVERLGALLTHEAVVRARRGAVIDGLSELQSRGVIGKFGHSGELANVLPMLAGADVATRIAQVSILDIPTLPPVGEVRGFNLARLAHGLLADPITLDTLLGTFDAIDTGTAMSAALAWAHRAWPEAVFLINASTPERLTALVTKLDDARLARWVDASAARIAELLVPE
ncbi:aldo/keto reductase [Novosphingobium sp.]|uniref:aldo/keto reductase n=1 Tax=Novosphingobium sp. TaxID=1874826 RepID=UPI0025FC9616|nr:aldo/keto reductase [Novosphingobium sp.]